MRTISFLFFIIGVYRIWNALKDYGDEARSKTSLIAHAVLLVMDLGVQVATYIIIRRSYMNSQNNDIALSITWCTWAALDMSN